MSRPILANGKPYPRKRPVDWESVRRALRIRRDRRAMTANGYTFHETEWEILRGVRWKDVILDVQISADRKHVWVKTGPAPVLSENVS